MIAVGGSACRWIESVEGNGQFRSLCVAAIGECAALARQAAVEVIEIGADTKPRPFCRIEESWAARAVQDDAQSIVRKVGDAEVVVLVTDLVEPFSRGAALAIGRLHKARGLTVTVIAALPFRFGSAREIRQAHARLRECESSVDYVLSLNFDELVNWVSPQTAFSTIVTAAGEAVSTAVGETLRIIGRQGGTCLRQGLARLESQDFLRHACARFLAGNTTRGNHSEV